MRSTTIGFLISAIMVSTVIAEDYCTPGLYYCGNSLLTKNYDFYYGKITGALRAAKKPTAESAGYFHGARYFCGPNDDIKFNEACNLPNVCYDLGQGKDDQCSLEKVTRPCTKGLYYCGSSLINKDFVYYNLKIPAALNAANKPTDDNYSYMFNSRFFCINDDNTDGNIEFNEFCGSGSGSCKDLGQGKDDQCK